MANQRDKEHVKSNSIDLDISNTGVVFLRSNVSVNDMFLQTQTMAYSKM